MANTRASTLKEDYERDGFVVVRRLLPPDEVAKIRARFEEIWTNGVAGFFERKGERFVNHFDQNYPRIIHPHRFDAMSRALLIDPRLADIARELIDDEPIAAQTMYYWKPPGTKGQAPHQDNLYLQANDALGCIGAWIAIEACDVENGCMFMVPGSHRKDLQCPESADPKLSFSDHHVKTPEGLAEVAMVMAPGDVVFFGGHTIHGSGPNVSKDRSRRSFICHYIGSRSTQSAGFYNPLIRLNGEEFNNDESSMGSPCGTQFDGAH